MKTQSMRDEEPARVEITREDEEDTKDRIIRCPHYRTILTGLLSVFLVISAQADRCPGSDTCPTNQYAIAEATAAEVKWIEPDPRPSYYLVTSTPSAPGQPVWVTTGNPNDWEDILVYKLQPGIQYTFTICAWYSASNQSCATTTPVTTLPGSTGGSATPIPTITQSSATADSISISWSGGRNYDFYQVSQLQCSYVGIGLPDQDNGPGSGLGPGPTGSWTFKHLPAEMCYQVAVQGCLYGGWKPVCSHWASENITTAPPPPSPPQNPHTTSDGWSEIKVLWTNPPGVTYAETYRDPGWKPDDTFRNITGGMEDLAAISGQVYTYKVCLHYQSGTACGSTTGMSQAPPPAPPPLPLLAPTAIEAAWISSSEVSLVWTPASGSRTTAFEVQHRIGIAPLSDFGASPWATVATLGPSAWSYSGSYPKLMGGLLQIFQVCASDGTNTACTTPVAVNKSLPVGPPLPIFP